MTKFTDRLENDLSHIADQASPSPTAWAAIQQRMAEPEPNEARDIIMLTDEREQLATAPDRRWITVAAAIAIGVLAIGAFALGRGDDEDLLITDDPPAEEVVDEDIEEDSAPDTTSEEPSPLLSGLPVGGLTTTDDLGMTLTFDTPVTMETVFVEPGFFSLMKPSDVDDDVGIIVATRVGGWYDAEQSVDNIYRGEGSIAANDVERWIEANQHVAERLPDAVVSDRTARVYDITVDQAVEGSLFDECDRCVLTSSPSSEFFDPLTAQSGNKVINPGLKLRLWFIEVDDFDPIAIWAGGFGDDATYVDEFEATVLPTIEIGPDAGPVSVQPFPAVPGLPLDAGVVRTDLLGETLSFETSERYVVRFARPGEIQLEGPGQKFVVLAQIGGWYSRSEAVDNTYLGQGSIDPSDPQAFLDENGFIAERRPDLDVSGRTAMVWDIDLDLNFEGGPFPQCGNCVQTYTVSSRFFDPAFVGTADKVIAPGSITRMYVVEGIDGSDPYVFLTRVGGSGDDSFHDEFEQAILPTIQFEPTE